MKCQLYFQLNLFQFHSPRQITLVLLRNLHYIFKYVIYVNTQWGWDKMAAISQTTLPNAFSWMKMFEYRLRFHRSFVYQCPIDNIPALVKIMAWYRSGDKPLSESIMIRLLTHICVTRPQWVKWFHRRGDRDVQGCRKSYLVTMSNMFTLIELIMNNMNTCGH